MVSVEAALITPLLALLVFGLIEFSLIIRDYTGVSSAARVGVRIASTGADSGPCVAEVGDTTPCPPNGSPELAQQAADQVAQTASAVPKNSVDYLMVYKANDAGFPGTATASIDLAQCVQECVAYRWSAGKQRFRYAQGTWDSRTISACADPALGTLDSVGVEVVLRHDLVTGLFGSTMRIADHAVMKFEPLGTVFCAAGRHP